MLVRANDEPAKVRIRWRGLPISIETPGGTTRYTGSPREVEVPLSFVGYGYFENMPAADGDSLDVLVGPGDIDGPVFLAEQLEKGTSQFFQWKVLLGFEDEEGAREGFVALWPEDMLGSLHEIDVDTFKSVLPELVVEANPRMASGPTPEEIEAIRRGRGRGPHGYPWGNFELEAEHPHTSVPEPPAGRPAPTPAPASPVNEQVVQRGQGAGDYYRGLATQYGKLDPSVGYKPVHYNYKTHEPAIDDMIKSRGYQTYFAGGKYGRPDLANRNYTTGHLMVYDPTPGQGGDFDDEAMTRSWRKIHELSHAETYGPLNEKYGEGRRIGKLGYHRTLREAKRAVEWEWLAVHKQRELSESVGHPIDEATFAREVNCLDAETEALTQRGWVRGFDLHRDDVLLTKNPHNGALEWQAMTDLKLFPDYEGPVVEFKSKSFHTVTTPEHRWLVTTNQGRVRERTSTTLVLKGDQIHRVGDYAAPSNSLITPDEAELLGWFVTDGTYKRNPSVLSGERRRDCMTRYAEPGIYAQLIQSQVGNPEKCSRIDALLTRLDTPGEVRRSKPVNSPQVWTLGPRLTRLLRELAPDRVLTVQTLLKLDTPALLRLREAMLLGDGSRHHRTGQTTLITGRREQAEAFQVLLTLTGTASTLTWRDMSKYAPHSEKLKNVPRSLGCYIVTALKRAYTKPETRHKHEYTARVGMWCPVVPNTFFVARRSACVFITGNTVMHDAVHRAVTGKFTNPDEEGFVPSDSIVPLEVSLGQLEEAARKMGLQGEDDLLKPRTAESLTRGQYREVVHKALKAKLLGEFEGLSIYKVDGLWVRDNLDVDFVAGGTFARYGYIPEGEVWVEDMADKDVAACIVHEVVECDAMLEGLSYDEAHGVAAEVEAFFRDTWDGEGTPFKAAEKFLLSAPKGIEVTAADLGGLQLSRSGYQRYVASWEDEDGKTHKVWIGGSASVEHGSYDGNKRQRRKMVWTVKVDGKEIGEAGTLREAKQLAEEKLGIEAAPATALEEGPATGGADPLAILRDPSPLTVTAADLEPAPAPAAPAPALPEVRGSPEFVEFMQDYLAVLPLQQTEAPAPTPAPGGSVPGPATAPRVGAIEITADDLTPAPAPARDPSIVWPPPAAEPLPRLPGKRFGPGSAWHLYTVQPDDWYSPKKRQVVPADEHARLQRPHFKKQREELGKLRKLPAGTVFDMWRKRIVPPEELERARAEVPEVSTKSPAEREQLQQKILPVLEPEQRQRLQELKQQRETARSRPPPQSDVPFTAFNLTPDGGLRNIIEVLRHATQPIVDKQKDWYTTAHKDAQAIADEKGVPVDLVSALIAILSPNTQWSENVFAAKQMLSGMGREVIQYREYLDEEAVQNWAVKIYPELYTTKKSLGVMVYLPNILKAQRAIDAFAASGGSSWKVDVAQPVKLQWTPGAAKTADAPKKTRKVKPLPKKRPKRGGPMSVEEAERKYNELVARGWTARYVKPDPKKEGKPSWHQGAVIPLGAPFPRDAYGSRLVLNPPFKSGKTVARKMPSGERKLVTEDSPKITAFHESILHPEAHLDTVVLDGHAINIWRGKPQPLNLLKKNKPTDAQAEMMRSDYRKAAGMSKKILGGAGVKVETNLRPQQIQAVTWVLWSDALKAMPKADRAKLFGLEGDDIGGGDTDEDEGEGEGEELSTSDIDTTLEPDEPTPLELPPPPPPRRARMVEVTAADLTAAWGPGGIEVDVPGSLAGEKWWPGKKPGESARRRLPFERREYPPARDWGPDVPWRDTPAKEPTREKVELAAPGERKKKEKPGEVPELHLRPDGGYSNIMKVLELASPEEVDYWGKWYPYAASVVRQMASKYKLDVKTVAAVVAVLSPGNKWHNNIAVAKQIIEWFLAREEFGPWSSPTLSGIGGFDTTDAPEEAEEFGDEDGDEDEDEDEDGDEDERRSAQLGRPYDFKFKKPKRGEEPLDVPELAKKGPKQHPMGQAGPHPSGYPRNAEKALAILGGADPEAMVTGPKVTVFYQSLLDPEFVKDKLVLDGHAINLWRGEKRPLKGLKTPAEGSPEREKMLADYHRAAKESGLSVQAVQAITWFVWKSVSKPKTAHATLEVTVEDDLHVEAANMKFPDKVTALKVILAESNLEYPPDFTQPDAAYARWKQQYAANRYGPKPVYEGGELDAINEALSLRGDRRVSGLLEGWERLTVGVRRWTSPRLEAAIKILNEVPGLEALRLPEFVTDRLVDSWERARYEDMAYEFEYQDEGEDPDAPGAEREPEPGEVIDTSFDPDEFEKMSRQRTALMRAEDTPGESVGVFLRVPESLARLWPKEGRAGYDDSPPHFTVLYLGAVPEGCKDELISLVARVAAAHGPLPIELSKGVSWFENHKGQQIAHKGVHPKTLSRMEALHEALSSAVTSAGFEVKHKKPFIAHSTLAYCDEQKYSGSVPEGGWTAREVEVWGWPDDEKVTLGSPFARAARRWKVPVALGGEPLIITAADLKQAAASNKSKRKEKRKRFMGETYWLPRDGSFARTRSVDAGEDATEIRLESGARILHEGDRDLIDLHGGAEASLEDVMKMALEKGYDAVRVKDRLAILNQDAIAERTPKTRPGWHK